VEQEGNLVSVKRHGKLLEGRSESTTGFLKKRKQRIVKGRMGEKRDTPSKRTGIRNGGEKASGIAAGDGGATEALGLLKKKTTSSKNG